jgi:signal transduction histidine kinase
MIRLLAVLLVLGLVGAGPAAAAVPFDQRVAAVRAEILVDPQRALADAQAMPAAYRDGADQPHVAATAAWLQAESLLSLNRPAEALAVTRNALTALGSGNGEEGIKAELILARAGAAKALGRVEDALRDNQLAYRMFVRAKDARGSAKALHYIGSLYLDGGDPKTALRYFGQSIEAFSSDPALLLSAQNNRAIAFSQLGQFKEAVAAYQAALKYVPHDAPTQSLILRNMARAQAEAGQMEAAQASLSRAFALSTPGVAGSDRPALYGVAAFVALRQHQLDRARTWIDHALEGVASVDPETQLDLHHTAYEIYRGLGEDAKALKELEAYRKLDDAQRAVAASATAALASARFNFTNQEIRFKSERAVEQARFRNRMQLALLSAAVVISTLLLIGFLSIRRSRNQVREANTSLLTTNVALEKALAAKTEFLATTSHEIRTPLNGILGMTQVILAGRALDPTLRGRIELVQGAGETMKALVDDILDVAKMETGELRIQTAEMDLKRLLEDAVTVWTGQAETKRIGIEFELDNCPAKIIADEVRLRQIIFNLMSNAIKFTDRGQVRLACFSETDEETEAETLVIRVADSGIGIPQDRVEEIFESFRQVDGGVTRRHGGTGLGLAICRNLARAMGGDVTVTSTLGAGSTFTLTLPLERGAAEIAPADRAAATNLATANLLMIEPNPLGQGIMRALLAGECASVQFVTEIGQARDALKAGAVDHVLAEGSGLGLDPAGAGALAAACADAKARFTLLWREPTAELLEEFAKAGVGHVVAKPISAPDLLSEMNKVYGEPIASRNIAA